MKTESIKEQINTKKMQIEKDLISRFESREFEKKSYKRDTIEKEIDRLCQSFAGPKIGLGRTLHQEDEIYELIISASMNELYDFIESNETFYSNFTIDKVAKVWAEMNYMEYLRNCLEELKKQSNEVEPKFKNTNASERFEYLRQLGFLEILKTSKYTLKSQKEILSKILDVNYRTAAGFLQGETKYGIRNDNTEKVKEALENMEKTF